MPVSKMLATWKPRNLHAFATSTGVLTASVLLTALLWPTPGKEGIEEPAKLMLPTFQVAMMSGVREETVTAQETIEKVVEEKTVEASPVAQEVVTENTASSLPDAVATTAEATPAVEDLEPPPEVETEVIPPAQVAMPGGKLMAVDAEVGIETPDILSVGKQEVILRYLINRHGLVERGGIFRQGSDPLRDTFIHKAMKNQTYNIKDWPMVQDGENPLWMVELVVPYNKYTEEVLP